MYSMIYLVMNKYNIVIARIVNKAEATACARAHGGFVVLVHMRNANKVMKETVYASSYR